MCVLLVKIWTSIGALWNAGRATWCREREFRLRCTPSGGTRPSPSRALSCATPRDARAARACKAPAPGGSLRGAAPRGVAPHSRGWGGGARVAPGARRGPRRLRLCRGGGSRRRSSHGPLHGHAGAADATNLCARIWRGNSVRHNKLRGGPWPARTAVDRKSTRSCSRSEGRARINHTTPLRSHGRPLASRKQARRLIGNSPNTSFAARAAPICSRTEHGLAMRHCVPLQPHQFLQPRCLVNWSNSMASRQLYLLWPFANDSCYADQFSIGPPPPVVRNIFP